MADIFDLKNETVKKFHDHRKKEDKQFSTYLFGIVILYILLVALALFNALPTIFLVAGVLLSFCFLFWLIESEKKDIDNRVNMEMDYLQKHIQEHVDDLWTEIEKKGEGN